MIKEYLSLHEVFRTLSSKKEINSVEGENLSYVERVKLGNLDAKKAKKDLAEQFELEEKVSVKLIDLMPASKENLVAILSSYGIIKDDKEVQGILDYLLSVSS
ncbi:MAG: hypothetical protein M1148_02690 [Candidatus Thermoplasmatota archaeon]|nr:hypothetical protein [Candidatus Thermoplasmatota archaeon]